MHKAISNLLAGAIAGASVESALYPIDTIKTRLQAMKGSVGMKDKVMALRGSNSLYSGLLGNLVGVIPASALFFTVYEPVKEKLSDPKVGIPGWCAQFAAAASVFPMASPPRTWPAVLRFAQLGLRDRQLWRPKWLPSRSSWQRCRRQLPSRTRVRVFPASARSCRACCLI